MNINNKYTHILSIKIWSDKCKIYTNYGNILENVKNAIVINKGIKVVIVK